MNNSIKTFDTIKEFKKFLKTLKTLPNGINRPVIKNNTDKIVLSILINGLQREINVVYTDMFEGTLFYYIVDGQHLVHAILGIPDKDIKGACVVRINQAESKEEIIRLASSLNAVGRKWSLSDYLNSWINLGKEDYKVIRDTAKLLNINVNAVIEMYSDTFIPGNDEFKNGMFKANKSKGAEILSIYEDLLSYGLNKSNSSLASIVRLFNDRETADNLRNIVKNNAHLFREKMSRDSYISIYKKLKRLM